MKERAQFAIGIQTDPARDLTPHAHLIAETFEDIIMRLE